MGRRQGTRAKALAWLREGTAAVHLARRLQLAEAELSTVHALLRRDDSCVRADCDDGEEEVTTEELLWSRFCAFLGDRRPSEAMHGPRSSSEGAVVWALAVLMERFVQQQHPSGASSDPEEEARVAEQSSENAYARAVLTKIAAMDVASALGDPPSDLARSRFSSLLLRMASVEEAAEVLVGRVHPVLGSRFKHDARFLPKRQEEDRSWAASGFGLGGEYASSPAELTQDQNLLFFALSELLQAEDASSGLSLFSTSSGTAALRRNSTFPFLDLPPDIQRRILMLLPKPQRRHVLPLVCMYFRLLVKHSVGIYQSLPRLSRVSGHRRAKKFNGVVLNDAVVSGTSERYAESWDGRVQWSVPPPPQLRQGGDLDFDENEGDDHSSASPRHAWSTARPEGGHLVLTQKGWVRMDATGKFRGTCRLPSDLVDGQLALDRGQKHAHTLSIDGSSQSFFFVPRLVDHSNSRGLVCQFRVRESVREVPLPLRKVKQRQITEEHVVGTLDSDGQRLFALHRIQGARFGWLSVISLLSFGRRASGYYGGSTPLELGARGVLDLTRCAALPPRLLSTPKSGAGIRSHQLIDLVSANKGTEIVPASESERRLGGGWIVWQNVDPALLIDYDPHPNGKSCPLLYVWAPERERLSACPMDLRRSSISARERVLDVVLVHPRFWYCLLTRSFVGLFDRYDRGPNISFAKIFAEDTPETVGFTGVATPVADGMVAAAMTDGRIAVVDVSLVRTRASRGLEHTDGVLTKFLTPAVSSSPACSMRRLPGLPGLVVSRAESQSALEIWDWVEGFLFQRISLSDAIPVSIDSASANKSSTPALDVISATADWRGITIITMRPLDGSVIRWFGRRELPTVVV
jgi:hypothetical protein